ncbi:MAG: DUF488 domain-containing protein [Devosia sp.]|uniref:DUF488 domain-containing protein n=1 Tax=Devosia sp. TaxID=1871048 RepID=UPI001A3FB724|nr:DUF488 domain-containing protein [Devosia sp.]MBL8600180.1 DUF488 domain-containing protein [Devosia sp.]
MSDRLVIKRVYLPPDKDDGQRVLVDRLWPRGVSKREAAIDVWLKDVAPSAALRKWFGHDPQRWEEFRRRYLAELADNTDAVDQLRELAKTGRVTLLYGALDEEHNQARVLLELLRGNKHGAQD